MFAVCRILHLDKPDCALLEAHHDVRVVVANLKKLLGEQTLTR